MQPNLQATPHARDLGYLARFLDKLEAEAKSLGGQRGERLLTLLLEERARWDEIQSLLAGASSGATPPSASAPAPAGAGGQAGQEVGAPSSRVVQAWTVGGLQV